MKSYNIKCKGCGIYLNDDEKSMGYVKNYKIDITKYCKRCFDIKHYNKCETIDSHKDEIVNVLDSLVLDNYIIFVVIDVLDIKNSLIEKYKDHDNVVYIINKMDLLPMNHIKELTEKNIIDDIDQLGYQYRAIAFTSIKSTTSIKLINDILNDDDNYNKKFIFIGKSNTGKSTLIKRICLINKSKESIVASKYLNTTNHLNKLKINRHVVIDTPGFINEYSILNFLDLNDVNKIQYQTIKKPKSYQIFESRTYKIENVATINIYSSKKSHITFYIEDKLNIASSKLKPEIKLNNLSNYVSLNDNETKITTFEFNDTDKKNIVISGLGLLSFQNIEKIEVLTNDKVNINLLLKQII